MTGRVAVEAPLKVTSPQLLVLITGTFAVGTDAFIIAGLLPEISGSLRIDLAQAGQLITGFALAYAVLAPVLAATTARWPRKRLLVGALVLFSVANVMTAVATTYIFAMFSRVAAAAGAAMVTPTSSIVAASLVPPAQRGKAIAVAVSGLTVSTAFGAPLGTVLGSALGWRAGMIAVAALGLIAAVAIWTTLPPVSAPQAIATSLRHRITVATERSALKLYMTTLVSFTSIYLVYSYASAVFEPATSGSTTRLAVVMFAFGLGAIFGNVAAGLAADRYEPAWVVHAGTTALAVICALLVCTRHSFCGGMLSALLMGVAAFSLTTPQQYRLLSSTRAEPSVAMSLNASFIYSSVALGGALGGIILTAFGSAYLPAAASVFSIGGLVTSVVANPSAPRSHQSQSADSRSQ